MTRKSPNLVLTVENLHSACCGPPPNLHADGTLRCGYFQDTYGEQWVMAIALSAQRATVWNGDVGWPHLIEIRDGQILDTDVVIPPDAEAWMRLAWQSATGTELAPSAHALWRQNVWEMSKQLSEAARPIRS